MADALHVLVASPARIVALVVLCLLGLALLFAALRKRSRRLARARLEAAVCAVGLEALRDRLVPDGMGGTVHVDYLLLTPRGLLVVDLWDIVGNIFGGDQMTEWTVIAGPKRETFHNPQGAMYDRVAAVKALAGEVPVEGRLVFTQRGRFPKGLPRWTTSVESLRAEFPPLEAATADGYRLRFQAAWSALSEGSWPAAKS